MNVAEKYFLTHRIDELAEEVRTIITKIYTKAEPKNQEAVDEYMRVYHQKRKMLRESK